MTWYSRDHPHLIGRQLSHYTLVAKIGSGGMGDVFRAEDSKLGREVALKVLPLELATDPQRLERFQREAKTVAALNHPNIVTIFTVEETDGVHFLTMELVDGQTISDSLPPDGFSLERFLALATPIAEAVASAHGRGVVHRDLKPANVMVTREGDRVKVLDFGLAKSSATALTDDANTLATLTQTQAGTIAGTPQYMSPEQARGEAVDHRSDIFSLGVMLFEMATGERPFQGGTAIELLSALLKDPAPQLAEIKPQLPRHLGRVIGRCLEKAPADRYQTARDVYNELKTLRRESMSPVLTSAESSSPSADTEARLAQPEAPWIAVLPITSRGEDAQLEDFAEGLTQDITTGLSRFSYLLVVSGNSVRKLEGTSLDARQVGRELGARYAIEGSLRRGGSRVRVSIDAVDTRTGTHLWAETFDRNLGENDIFDIQDEITDRVVATIADPYGVLARSMAAPTEAKPPEQLSPYEAVLRFFLYQQRVGAEDHLPTRIALEHAVEVEPGNADAWAGLAIVLLDEDRHAFNPRPDALERALKAAQRGVSADSANQLANYALATVHYYRRELGAFRAAAERAIGLNRRDSNTTAMLGILMGYAGDWQRGIELTTAAMELNPHHPGWYRFTTFFHAYHQRRYDEALAVAQKIQLPEYFASHYALAIANAQLGNLDAARAATDDAIRLWPDFESQVVEGHFAKWLYAQPDLIEHVIEGLELAGLRVRPGRKGDGGPSR